MRHGSGRPACFCSFCVGDDAVFARVVHALFMAEMRRQPRCCLASVLCPYNSQSCLRQRRGQHRTTCRFSRFWGVLSMNFLETQERPTKTYLPPRRKNARLDTRLSFFASEFAAFRRRGGHQRGNGWKFELKFYWLVATEPVCRRERGQYLGPFLFVWEEFCSGNTFFILSTQVSCQRGVVRVTASAHVAGVSGEATTLAQSCRENKHCTPQSHSIRLPC